MRVVSQLLGRSLEDKHRKTAWFLSFDLLRLLETLDEGLPASLILLTELLEVEPLLLPRKLLCTKAGGVSTSGIVMFMVHAAFSAASRTIQFSSLRQAATGDIALVFVFGPPRRATQAIDSSAQTAI